MFSASSLLPASPFLLTYRVPDLRFGSRDGLAPELAPIWKALRGGNERAAQALIRKTLTSEENTDSARAGLLAAWATAEARIGKLDESKRHASASLEAWPSQWLAHRAWLSTLTAVQDFEGAYAYLAEIEMPDRVEAWDEPLPEVHRSLAAAAWAWRLGSWDDVARHLDAAYPDGVETMPVALQEDWFRLALYRDQSADAVRAAQHLIAEQSPNASDLLLQALVKQGWANEALTLYRAAFTRTPRSALLRRRLVALCIRTGAIDEARRLSAQGPLQITV